MLLQVGVGQDWVSMASVGLKAKTGRMGLRVRRIRGNSKKGEEGN